MSNTHHTKRYQVGDYWLSQRSGNSTWNRTWFDEKTRQTRRISLGTSDFEDAKTKLNDWFITNNRPENAIASDVLIADIILDYYRSHGSKLPSAASIKSTCAYWVEFHKEATVDQAMAIKEQERFVFWLRERGFSTAYTQRIVGVGKAALNRAFKRGEIASMPYVLSVKVHYGAPQGRALKIEEVAKLLDHAPEHLWWFIVTLIGTACRPDAALSLQYNQLDFENQLIDLNPAGRPQTKKYRPIVKMPDILTELYLDLPFGPIVKYRSGPVSAVKTAWRNLRAECGFGQDVTPYSIRHTMARFLRSQGVPAWEVAAQLGHKSRDFRTTELYAPFDPTYLNQSKVAIDTYFGQLRAVCVSLRHRNVSPETPQTAVLKGKIGAGEVMLYP